MPEGKKKIKHDPANGVYVYPIRKFMRSNAATCINQKILVNKGDTVKKGQVIADGPAPRAANWRSAATCSCAFMPWNGYNFEDAILISEKIVKDDIFTSIHIDEFEVGARDTKLGPEEITRDIPNLGDEALKNLGPDGVIRIGAEVKPGDILVGKITPKSETELAPEERLLRAIFGEKGRGRERHLAQGSLRHLRHRHGRQGLLQEGANAKSEAKAVPRKSARPSRSRTSTRRRPTNCASN
jgi:DNA-directed RNA polymerase subunit beta